MLPDRVRRQAEEIARDTTSGALPLSLRVLDTYRLLEGPLATFDAAEALHHAFIQAQPWMAAVRNTSLLGRDLVGRGRVEEIATLRERIRGAQEAVAKRAAPILQGAETVVTISYSSDVFEALSAGPAGEPPTVYVCESRPLQEGIKLTADLTDAGLDAILIADAAGPTFVSRADLVLCGADSLLRQGGLVNKIGTLSLALACREQGVPFRPLLEVLKVELEGQDIGWEEEARDPAELSPDVKALNFYFEKVPRTLLEVVVTDAGTEPPSRLVERFRTTEDLARFYRG